MQSHPARLELAANRLLPGLEGLDPTVVIDDGPPPAFPWRGYKMCLYEFLASGDSHGLIVQDDAVPCLNLAPALHAIVDRHPANVICLFVGGGAMGRLIADAPAHIVALPNGWYVPVVATLWTRELAADILAWEKTAPKKIVPNDKSDDGFVGLWRKRQGQIVLATNPCLVEHPDDVPSVLQQDERRARVRAQAGNDRNRVAFHFIGRGDPLEIDWAGGPAEAYGLRGPPQRRRGRSVRSRR